MQDTTDLGSALLAQDPGRGVVGAEHVNHERLSDRARGADVRAKDGLLMLELAGRAIEPALADRDDRCPGVDDGAGDRLGKVIGKLGVVEVGNDLGMDAERDPQGRVGARERDERPPGPGTERRHENPADARCPGAGQDLGTVAIEDLEIEVAVGVDHGGRGGSRISVVKLVRKGSLWLRTSDALVARWLRAAHAALLGEMPVLAAGTALFAIIAVVPTLAAAVAIYGLVADPFQIQSEIRGLHQVLPVEVVRFIGDQLERQAQRSTGELGLQLGVSVGLALISARGSARALTDALNRAYRVRDIRSPLTRLGLSLSMAVFTLVGLMTMFAVLVVLPALAGWINHDYISAALWLRWPALLFLVFLSLTLLYRYVPSPRPLGPRVTTDAGGPVNLPHRPVRHICVPGAGIATILLVLVSWVLSVWVDHIANTELIYGAFGSVVVTILWFYLSTMTLMIGGFVNAELERHAGAPQPDRSMY